MNGKLRYVVALLVAVGLAWGIQHRAKLRAEESKSAEPQNGPRKVLVTHAKGAGSAGGMTVPGTVRPAESTRLYARAQGFLREVKVNIGAKVKKGDHLATIEAPELLDQLTLARARLKEAQSNVPLVKARAERMTDLLAKGAVSQQEAEDATRAFNTATAAVSTAQADVARLGNTVSYLRVTAPFDGAITKRLADPGAVVNGGTTALLEVASAGALKVVVDVPQTLAPVVNKDFTADVTTKGGVNVKGTFLRTANAIDEVTRTLRVELAVPENPGLLAGSYVDVKISATGALTTKIIPATTLSVGALGTRVAVVRDNSTVEFRKVVIVRDMGRELEVNAELAPADRLVMFPPVELADGEPVNAVEKPN